MSRKTLKNLYRRILININKAQVHVFGAIKKASALYYQQIPFQLLQS